MAVGTDLDCQRSRARSFPAHSGARPRPVRPSRPSPALCLEPADHRGQVCLLRAGEGGVGRVFTGPPASPDTPSHLTLASFHPSSLLGQSRTASGHRGARHRPAGGRKRHLRAALPGLCLCRAGQDAVTQQGTCRMDVLHNRPRPLGSTKATGRSPRRAVRLFSLEGGGAVWPWCLVDLPCPTSPLQSKQEAYNLTTPL